MIIPIMKMLIITSLILFGCFSAQVSDNRAKTIVQIPSVIEYDLRNQSISQFMHLRIQADQQVNQQYQRLYFASNFIVQIYQSGTNITNQTDVWDLGLRECGSNITMQILISQHMNQCTQPLIIYVGYHSQNIIKPIRRNITYLMREHSKDIRSQPKGKLYLIKPYTHSLKAYIKILQGYPSILPYMCPNSKLGECQASLVKKIKEQHNQLMSNYYVMYSKISLNQNQIFDLDYCNHCYLILYLSCKIGQCSLQIGFDLGSVVSLQLSTLPSSNHQITQLREGRFSQLEGDKIYSFNSRSNSQIVYYNSPRIQQLYHSCSSYQMTYKIPLFTQFLLININKISSLDIPFIQQCWIKQQYGSAKSWIYYTNYLPQIMQINRQYPIKLTRQNPSIYHYKYSSHKTTKNNQILYLNVKKCMDGPIRLTYYVLPDFESIKNKKLQLFEKDKQTEDWVASKQIRIISSEASIKITKYEGEYLTDYLMMELVPDSYSYAIVSVTNEPMYPHTKVNNIIEVSKENYKETENENEISIHLQMKIMSKGKQKNVENLKVMEMNNTDTFYKEEQCKEMTVLSKQESSMSIKPRIITQKSFAYEIEDQVIRFNISMHTYSKYVGISVQVDRLHYSLVLEVKSKINLIYKFKWILLFSVLIVVMIIYAAYQLSISLKHTNQ